jgi:hypothetical protein
VNHSPGKFRKRIKRMGLKLNTAIMRKTVVAEQIDGVAQNLIMVLNAVAVTTGAVCLRGEAALICEHTDSFTSM